MAVPACVPVYFVRKTELSDDFNNVQFAPHLLMADEYIGQFALSRVTGRIGTFAACSVIIGLIESPA